MLKNNNIVKYIIILFGFLIIVPLFIAGWTIYAHYTYLFLKWFFSEYTNIDQTILYHTMYHIMSLLFLYEKVTQFVSAKIKTD